MTLPTPAEVATAAPPKILLVEGDRLVISRMFMETMLAMSPLLPVGGREPLLVVRVVGVHEHSLGKVLEVRPV